MSTFDFITLSAAGAGFVYKNTTNAYYFNGTSFLPIGINAVFTVDASGSGGTTMNITGVTSGAVAPGQLLSGSGLAGTTILSLGTFNGTSGTINLAAAQTWSAGSVSASTNYPATTVRGVVYLDGTYYVMDPNGIIWGSNLADPTGWSSLNQIPSQMEPDGGVCLARQLNMVVSLSQYSTEFFYDAGNALGSPLSSFPSAMLEIGCASGDSVAQIEQSLFFIGVSKAKGRSIYKIDGTTPTMISTPAIDRILNADSLSSVSAYCIKLSGHGFYFITLRTSGITLVYDFTTQQWSKWTSLVLSSTKTLSAASWSLNTVIATVTGHGYSDGDCVVVAGVTPSGYNGQYVCNVIDANTISYTQTTNPGTFVSAGTAANYTETYFNMASYTSGGGFDLVQDSTTGSIYAMDTGTYQDGTNPIRFRIRTPKYDAGDNKEKQFSAVEIIGDKVSSTSYVRYTNDDYQTWSLFRPIDMSLQRSRLNRQGRGRRRAYDMINYDNQPIRIESLELTVDEGFA